MNTLLGCLVAIIAVAAIVAMIVAMWKDTLDEIKRDAKFKNTVMATRLAERKYHEMLSHTEFIVHRNPVIISNESTIDWGSEKEVLL